MAISDRSLSSDAIAKGLTGSSGSYNTDSGDMLNRITCLSRLTGKLRDTFFKGPCRDTTILTLDKVWPSPLDRARAFLYQNNLYGFCLQGIDKEGASIWVLTPDDAFDTESLYEVINDDILSKKWMSAVNDAQKEMPEDRRNDPPFALMCVLSFSFNKIPWFGRVAWGTGYFNGVLSLTQIPTMNGNKKEYCTWSFVCKDPSFNEEKLYKEYTQGGNESTYDAFKKYRDFLLSDQCEPANPDGDYSFLKDQNNNLGNTDTDNNDEEENKESNPLIDAATKEGFFRSRTLSYSSAKKHLLMEYSIFHDKDEDQGESSGTTTASPKSSPFISDIRRENNYPVIGPVY